MNKDELRRAMREKRQALCAAQQRAASMAVFERLAAFAPYRQARCVMAYAACRGELDVGPAMEDVIRSGRTLVLPRCEAPGVMTARRVEDLSCLRRGAYGLMEPEDDRAIVPPDEIDLILVPGTAFDRTGGRIGQGGGYYDRFLEKTRALRVGICHDFALFDCIPTEIHDLRMDAIVTPQGIMNHNGRI